MARYAAFADVQARAGRFAGVFTVAGRRPNQTDVESILDDIGAELEAAVEARGVEPANLDQRAKDALRDLNAYGALARALPAASPGRQAAEIIDRAVKLYAGGLVAIGDGSSAVILNIEAGAAGVAGSTAGSFWEDEGVEIDRTPIWVRTQTL